MAKKDVSPAPSPATLGPIPDLERHLPAEWWRSLFNALYIKTDGDVVENDQNTAREVDMLVAAAGLEANDRILDLCCGQGRHSLELARRGFRHVTGVDRSRYLVRLARRRARAAGLTVAFREGDARRFRLQESTFHCVAIMGNSFGYFDRPEDDKAVLLAVKRVLRGGGILAMDLSDGGWMRQNFEPRSWEWIDAQHLVCRERSLASDGVRLISREVIVHAERGIIADQFYAERLYTAEEIERLLASAGFVEIRFHGELKADSTRGHDLGMMAHRLFLTAKAPAKPVSTGRKGPAWPEVTVVMGDPRLPDQVKRGGKFNAEDLDTVQRLKDALDELEGYTFRFANNHASLLSDLRQNPPQFVLNLCDEGYNNDALKELHVPAFLDMLDVRYTGAAPTCLGLCYNKSLVRAIAMSMDIPVPLETYYDPADRMATLPSFFPALAKPNTGDSSIGITRKAVVHTPEQLVTYIEELQDELPNRAMLVQEFLSGGEYSVGIIGNPGLSVHMLPVLEVDYSQLDPSLPRILGYESKWEPESPYWNQIRYHEARLPEQARQELLDWSMMLFDRLDCRDYARFDWRADAEGRIKLLEVNPNPGWCWDGKLNYMAELEGLRYADLIRMVLEAAQDRILAGAKPPSNGSSKQ